MKVAILNRIVRRNIALFKHLMEHQAQKERKVQQLVGKVYKAYVDCRTGDLHFVDLEGSPPAKAKHWKEVTIQMRVNAEGKIQAELCPSHQETSFNCQDLKPEAYKTLASTMKVLNRLLFDPSAPDLWEAKVLKLIKQIAQLDIEMTQIEEGKQNLIEEAWHDVNRSEAEHLLLNEEVGTYLIRRGEWTDEIEINLNALHPVPIKCMTLTYHDWNHKITEKLIVFKNDRWLFYNDDPELKGPSFNTLQALLRSLGSALEKPLS